MPRRQKTLSLSLPPEATEKLAQMGTLIDRTAAHVATEVVLDAIGMDRHGRGRPVARSTRPTTTDPDLALDEERIAVARLALERLVDGVRARSALTHAGRARMVHLAYMTMMQLQLALSSEG